MRNCKLILIVGLLSLMFSACLKHYSAASLVVKNESGEDLWVESYIVSADCDSTKSFLLREGNSELIAISERSKAERYADLSLGSCVFNNDAYVRVYKIDSLGTRTLAHTWYYADRNSDGRELFNDSCIEKKLHDDVAGDVVVLYQYTFLPEDIYGDTNLNTDL